MLVFLKSRGMLQSGQYIRHGSGPRGSLTIVVGPGSEGEKEARWSSSALVSGRGKEEEGKVARKLQGNRSAGKSSAQ